MKSLKESLLDNPDIQARDLKRLQIEEWLKENNHMNSKYKINPDYTIDIDEFNYKGEGDFPEYIHFNICNDDFDCVQHKMTTLRGCPKIVRGSFNCAINCLTNLKGGPKQVGKNYTCSANYLESLEGCAQKVGRNFICKNNIKLKSLEGGPKKVGDDYLCSYCNINSLKGCPKVIPGDFSCAKNFLKDFKDGPTRVYNLFIGDNPMDEKAIQWIKDNVKYNSLNQ